MPDVPFNKYRAAIEVLYRGRDLLVENLAQEILDQCETLVEGGFQFHEFLELHGTRLHFLTLLLSHLEQSADALDAVALESPRPGPSPAQPSPRTRRRSRPRASRPATPPKPSPPEEPTDDIPF